MKSNDLAALKTRIESAPLNARGRRRCPVDLRSDILRYAVRRRREGVSVDRLAEGLGLESATLAKWLRERAKASKSRRVKAVEVTDRVESVSVAPQRAQGIRLVLSNGHRVEGLDIDQLAKLMQALP